MNKLILCMFSAWVMLVQAQSQTFKGHHIDETTDEFLRAEPAVQANLSNCQSTALRELTPDEIKKSYGKKTYEN